LKNIPANLTITGFWGVVVSFIEKGYVHQ